MLNSINLKKQMKKLRCVSILIIKNYAIISIYIEKQHVFLKILSFYTKNVNYKRLFYKLKYKAKRGEYYGLQERNFENVGKSK